MLVQGLRHEVHSQAFKDIKIACVPLTTAIADFDLVYFDILFSNKFTYLPDVETKLFLIVFFKYFISLPRK